MAVVRGFGGRRGGRQPVADNLEVKFIPAWSHELPASVIAKSLIWAIWLKKIGIEHFANAKTLS
jgi:hypothetical protein